MPTTVDMLEAIWNEVSADVIAAFFLDRTEQNEYRERICSNNEYDPATAEALERSFPAGSDWHALVGNLGCFMRSPMKLGAARLVTIGFVTAIPLDSTNDYLTGFSAAVPREALARISTAVYRAASCTSHAPDTRFISVWGKPPEVTPQIWSDLRSYAAKIQKGNWFTSHSTLMNPEQYSILNPLSFILKRALHIRR